MTDQGGTATGEAAPPIAGKLPRSRWQQLASLRRHVLIAVPVTAALRALLFLLSTFAAWPVGGVATFALARVQGFAPLGVALELALRARRTISQSRLSYLAVRWWDDGGGCSCGEVCGVASGFG